MVTRRITLLAAIVSRKAALFVACAIGLMAALPPARGEQLIAYKLEISTSYIGLAGEAPRATPSFSSGGSVLQQWMEAARPFVRITNISSDPRVNLFGAQLDLTKSGSMITALEWVQGVTGNAATWNWNADLASAFFQFHDPLAPGESVLMRLSTAPRPGMGMQYRQNQTLFHSAIGNCIETTTNYATLDVWSQPYGSTTPVEFEPSGQPTGPGLIASTVPLDTPLTPADLNNPSSIVITPVPVPEPDTIVLAASAAAMLVFVVRRRGGRAA